MKRFNLAMAVVFVIVSMISITSPVAAGGRKAGVTNDHGLVVCEIQEQVEVSVENNPILTVIFECADDSMEFHTFIAVDKRYNLSVIDEFIAAAAASGTAAKINKIKDFYATIGRYHFFKATNEVFAER